MGLDPLGDRLACRVQVALPGLCQESGAPSCPSRPPEGGYSCSPGVQAGVERLKDSELPALGAPRCLGTLVGEEALIQLPRLWALHPAPARPGRSPGGAGPWIRRRGATGSEGGGPGMASEALTVATQ